MEGFVPHPIEQKPLIKDTQALQSERGRPRPPPSFTRLSD